MGEEELNPESGNSATLLPETLDQRQASAATWLPCFAWGEKKEKRGEKRKE